MLLALSLLPSLLGAIFAVVSSTIGSLSPARLAAVRGNTTGANRVALERYEAAPGRHEARWLLIRVAGVAASAALVSQQLSHFEYGWLAALLLSTSTYALPSEFGIHASTLR